MSNRKFGLVLASLLVAYIFLYVLYVWVDFLPDWDAYGISLLNGVPLTGFLFVDPLLWLIPFVGFSFVWIGLSSYIRYFNSESVLSIPFGLVYLVSSYAVWFLAMLFYFWNNSFLVQQANGSPNPFFDSLPPVVDFVFQSFNDFLLKSPYFLFVLAGLLGWVSFVLIHKYGGTKSPHASE